MLDPAELRRHRRALRILVVVLIPLAIWTAAGLIAFWPGDVSDRVNKDVAGYNVPGVTYPDARITAVAEISCEGLPGSTPGQQTRGCADLSAEVLDGDDRSDRHGAAHRCAVRLRARDVGDVRSSSSGCRGWTVSRRSSSSPTSNARPRCW